MASSDTRLLKNAAARVYGCIKDNTTGRVITGGLTTLAATISKDGAAFAATGVTVTEIGTTGFFSVDITAAEFTSYVTVLKAESADSDSVDFIATLYPEEACDSGVAQAGAASTITLRSGASAVDSFYNGLEVEIVRGTGIGQTRTITAYVGSTKVATVDVAWGTNPDSTSVYKVHHRSPSQISNAAANANLTHIASTGVATGAANFFSGFTYGPIVDTGTTTNAFKGDTTYFSSTNDFYKNQFAVFSTGTLAGVARKITAYAGSTRQFTVYPPLPAAPANGVYFFVTGYAPE